MCMRRRTYPAIRLSTASPSIQKITFMIFMVKRPSRQLDKAPSFALRATAWQARQRGLHQASAPVLSVFICVHQWFKKISPHRHPVTEKRPRVSRSLSSLLSDETTITSSSAYGGPPSASLHQLRAAQGWKVRERQYCLFGGYQSCARLNRRSLRRRRDSRCPYRQP